MSPELAEVERQRQLLINELIDSEEQYVHAVNTTKDVSINSTSMFSYFSFFHERALRAYPAFSSQRVPSAILDYFKQR